MRDEDGNKIKIKKDYAAMGSLRNSIAKTNTLEELEQVRQAVMVISQTGGLSEDSLKRLVKLGAAKQQELARVQQMKGVLQAGDRMSPGGILLP